MQIAIVNGTNRIGNRSIEIAHTANKIIREMGYEVHLISLESFDRLFRGNYISLANATIEQRKDIRHLIAADMLLFIIPTYHSGIPSPLKNFLDSLKCNECYEQKIICVISSNDSNRDLGARQAIQVINGILAYNKLLSFVVPVIPTINFDDIDYERIENFIRYCTEFISRREKGADYASGKIYHGENISGQET